ncbi:hypothetical protein EK21DRAFT_82880 [Setomelanomma holmii]|uniref:SnoaL-like domain-containing protein n=1 Tax=Setomelanomma holmii TaxID=210430 RepID=A0A9P4LDX5_9PLEO|nr:hypothetical protein EK21DRAFT_82880 [Setomelanomma holmii]
MKLATLVFTTILVLGASKPLTSPGPIPSDILIGLNLDRHIINVNITLQQNILLTAHSVEAQRTTAQTVIDAYNAWDIDQIMAYRTPDCQHQVLPSSMGRAAKSNDEYRAYLSTIMPLYSNFTVTVLEQVHDAETHTCIIHASSAADTKIGRYSNEYALILTFTEDGKQVSRFDEFVDSAYSRNFTAALAKAT